MQEAIKNKQNAAKGGQGYGAPGEYTHSTTTATFHNAATNSMHTSLPSYGMGHPPAHFSANTNSLNTDNSAILLIKSQAETQKANRENTNLKMKVQSL